jgi:tetratricopeptide (TPR) repeat protein
MPTMAQRLAGAIQAQAAGRLDEAHRLVQSVLNEAPDEPHSLRMLGLLLHQMGRHHDAIEPLRRSLAALGPHPAIHSNLGAVCLAAGLLDDAVAHCREAIRLQPALAVAHFNLGAALRRQDRLEEAEAAFRDAVRLNPRDIEAQCNLGVVCHQLGKLSESLARLREAVRLAPSHAQAHHDFGAVLLASGQGDLAVQHLREAIRLAPAFVEAHINLGLGLRQLNRVDAAVGCFHDALRLNPACVTARNHLANAWQAIGKIELAVAEFQEALRIEPGNAFALAALSNLAAAGHYQLTDVDIHAAEQRAVQEQLPLEDRHQLHFALAIELDRSGDYARAFEHYREGNALRKALERRRGVFFDPQAHDEFVDRIIATYTPAFFERVRSFGIDTQLPVFVVGMMRSGTTLAEQILASHPMVHGGGELALMETLINSLPHRLSVAAGYPEVLAVLDAATARSVALDYVRSIRERGGAAERVVDKLPANFLNLGLIATLFPQARIIHCRRDPLDTCLSCYFQNFGGPVPHALDLEHLGRYYRAYERLMAHWARVLPVPVFELPYEELTAEPEMVSRRLIAFCGLAWDQQCLRFHQIERLVRTASLLQVRRPIYRSSVGRWRNYAAFLGPLIEAMGGPKA